MRFSVIITCRNQREFIRDAVDSALAAGEVNCEVIVVDDGSTDGSQKLLAEYADTIRFLPLPANVGKGAARNVGARAALGAYLLFLDGDDALMPWTLRVYERIVSAREPKLILCTMWWFADRLPDTLPVSAPRDMRLVEYPDYFRKDRQFGVSASSLVIERGAFEAVHGWATERFVMQDQDLVLRLGDAGKTIHILSPPTVLHRKHARQTINRIAPFIGVLYQLVRNERAGRYPGGQPRRRDRAVIFGGLAFFWIRRAMKARMYIPALKLLVATWPMIAQAVLRRLTVISVTKRPCETLPI